MRDVAATTTRAAEVVTTNCRSVTGWSSPSRRCATVSPRTCSRCCGAWTSQPSREPSPRCDRCSAPWASRSSPVCGYTPSPTRSPPSRRPVSRADTISTDIRVRRPPAGQPGRKQFISGKHRFNTVKATTLCDESERLIWVGAWRPGRVYDQTAIASDGIWCNECDASAMKGCVRSARRWRPRSVASDKCWIVRIRRLGDGHCAQVTLRSHRAPPVFSSIAGNSAAMTSRWHCAR